jgi:hypothetical protein
MIGKQFRVHRDGAMRWQPCVKAGPSATVAFIKPDPGRLRARVAAL